ncbi:tail fiber protein [Prochlorococcus phage P-TIM68]|uniref:Putative tail fiber protein n=1 Tax=Prochlorococcus phage P-TIM68 TaxID=1542477 RepID=A0A0K0KVR6_9CAUD|nr:tail fiber protein [Prochlorococcus phage P-TIM68]AIR93412.1 putative tail fiber protein [Prochlorococcus phage P-TIM68]
MSTLKTNNIQHVDRSDPSILINTDGSVSIAGTMTYEDVTNVDAVGIITGRNNIDAQKQVLVGTGVSVKAGGLNVTAGITTVQALQAQAISGTTGTFSGAVSGTRGTFSQEVDIAQDLVHTGDTDTKISFGTDSIRLDTAGALAVQVVSDQKVGFGTNNPQKQVDVYNATAGTLRVSNSSKSVDLITNSTGGLLRTIGSYPLTFNTNQTDRMTLDSNGRLLLGTTTEGHSNADDLTIATSANTGITIRSGTSNDGNIFFSDATSGSGETQGTIKYDHGDDKFTLNVNGSTRLSVNSSGNSQFTGIVTATEFIPTESQLSHRNRIINGSMRIAQRATSSTSQGIRTCDRWDTYAAGMDQLAYTQKQVTDSPDGFGYSYEIDITTAESAQAGDEYMRVQQKIEAQDLQYLAYGTSSAKTVTVSFWVKAYQTGTYVVNFYRQDATRQITRTYTVNASATWEYKSVTIPGDTTGGGINNDTGAGIHLAFILIADSGYTSTDSTSWINYTDAGYGYGQTVNLGSSTNNYWKITGVQFEQGSQPTPFENQKFDDILFACQRYYCELGRKVPGSDTIYGFIGLQAYTTSALFGTLANFPRRMRALPTVTTVGNVKFSNKSGGNVYSPSGGTMGNANTHFSVGTTGITYSTAHFVQGGFACGFTDNDNANYNYITADAEI